MDVLDEDGAIFPDLALARDYAVNAARDLVCEDVHKGHLNLDHRIDIADETGAVVMTVAFRDAFMVTGC
jgi:hypothetical protein